EVKDVGGGDGAGAAFADTRGEMRIDADAAAGDDRQGRGVGHAADEGKVVALAGAVAVDRVEEDLAGAAALCLACPCGGIAAGRALPVGGIDLIAAVREALGVDRDDDALRAVAA